MFDKCFTTTKVFFGLIMPKAPHHFYTGPQTEREEEQFVVYCYFISLCESLVSLWSHFKSFMVLCLICCLFMVIMGLCRHSASLFGLHVSLWICCVSFWSFYMSLSSFWTFGDIVGLSANISESICGLLTSLCDQCLFYWPLVGVPQVSLTPWSPGPLPSRLIQGYINVSHESTWSAQLYEHDNN